MAQGVAVDFDFAELGKAIKKAESELNHLVKTTDNTANSIVNTFRSMSLESKLDASVKKLSEMRTVLRELGVEQLKAFGSGVFREGLGEDIKNTIDIVSQLTTGIGQLQHFINGVSGASDEAFSGLIERLHESSFEVQRMNKYYSELERIGIEAQQKSSSAKNSANEWRRAWDERVSVWERGFDVYQENIKKQASEETEHAKNVSREWAESYEQRLRAWERMFDEISKREAKEENERRLKSPQGALEYASNAKSQAEMEQAMKYLDTARKNIDVTTKEGIDLNDALIKKYGELKTAIEELEGKTKDQNTLVATESAKYARLLKEIEKYKKSLEELRKTEAYKSGDVQARNAESDLQDEIRILEKRKDLYAANKESIKQASIQVAADTAREETEIIKREEAQRAKEREDALKEARQRYAELLNEEDKLTAEFNRGYDVKDKYGDDSDNIKAAQEKIQQEWSKVYQERRELEEKYQNELTDIQEKHQSERNKKALANAEALAKKQATKAAEAEKKAAEETEKKRRTTSGAIEYAKEAKTIKELVQAYKYLDEAKKNVNISTKDGKKEFKDLSRKMDEVRGALLKYGVTVSGTVEKHKQLFNTGDQLKRMFTGLFSVSAIRRYISQVVNLRGEFELQQRSLQALIQNKDEADKLWNKTIQLAVRSPYNVKELVTYTKQLAAYRLETEKLHDTTKMLADISAGLGVDMQRLILAYGQVKAANYLRGTELRQFSEAGINVLGELSKYFTELEGRVVTVGDVFERVSKRMVSFADVEAVLKDMTDIGGEFYNMQEIQAETLKGLTSNLRDQFDLMINDIGKANEGLLKGGVKAVAELIKHYKELHDIIRAIVVSMTAMVTISSIQNWKTLVAGANTIIGKMNAGETFKQASAGLRGIDGIIKKLIARIKNLKGSFNGLVTFFKSPKTLGIGVFTLLLSLIVRHNKRVKEANKAYDELVATNSKAAIKLQEYNSEIEKNNKLLDANNKIKNDTTVTEKERNIATEKAIDAESENIALVNKLKNEYPALANYIGEVKNGYVDLADAMKVANAEMATSSSLAESMKASFFDSSLGRSYNKASTSLDTLEESEQAFDKLASDLIGDIILKNKDANYENLRKIVDEAKQSALLGDNLEAKRQILTLEEYGQNVSDLVFAVMDLSNASDDFGQKRRKFNNDIAEGREHFELLYQTYKNIGLSEDDAQESLKSYIDTWLTSMGIIDKRLRDIATESILLNMDFELNFDDKKTTDEVKKAYKKIAQDIIEVQRKENKSMEFVYAISGIEETTSFAEAIGKVTSGWKEAQEKLTTLKDTNKEYSEEEIKQLNLQIKAWEAIAKEYGIVLSLDKDANKSASELNKKRIGLIKDMRSAYIEAEKYATTPDLSSFKDAFEELFKGTGIDFSQIIVSSSGNVAKTLNLLRPLVERVGGESGRLLMIEFEKAIGQYSTKSNTEGIDAYLNDTKTKINNLFEDYKSGLELSDMGFDDKMIMKLFGVESISLDGIKEYWESVKPILLSYGKEGIALYNEFSEKIDDTEDKEQKERLKKYSKYLLEAQSERLKIEKDTLRQIGEVEDMRKSGKYSDEQADAIIKGITDKRNKQIASLNWDEFRGSELYIQMFEDLGDKSYKTLSSMREQLKLVRDEMVANSEFIDPSDMKELVRAMEQIDDAMLKKNPLKGFGNSLEDYIELLGKQKEYEDQYANAMSNYYNAQERLRIATENRAQAEQNLKDAQESGDKNVIFTANVLANNAKKAEENARNAMEAASDGAKQATENMNSLNEATAKTSEGFNGMATILESISSLLSSIASYDNLWKTKEAKESFSNIAGMIGDLAGGATGVARVIANPADIGGYVQIITSLFGIVDKIFGSKQSKIDAQIDNHYKKVEELQKEYEELEKAIENAYNIQDLQRYNKELQDKIEEQKKHIAEAKAAAESGKDNEKNLEAAAEAQAKYDELVEQSAENAKELFSEATAGVFDDAISTAEGFIDAWLEAYREVGDGMSGLTEHMEELMEDMLKRQVAQAIVGQYINQLKHILESQINEKDLEWDEKEREAFMSEYKEVLSEVNEALKGIDWGDVGSNKLGGLQKGIQGITAEQADILAAYWNSVRFYMASVDQKFDIPLSTFMTDDTSVNPVLRELKNIATRTNDIYKLLDGVTTRGEGIKVLMQDV